MYSVDYMVKLICKYVNTGHLSTTQICVKYQGHVSVTIIDYYYICIPRELVTCSYYNKLLSAMYGVLPISL